MSYERAKKIALAALKKSALSTKCWTIVDTLDGANRPLGIVEANNQIHVKTKVQRIRVWGAAWRIRRSNRDEKLSFFRHRRRDDVFWIEA
jgi:hypothetical protein